MNINNNILKAYLKNCFFINGTAYAGKSTMCKMLAEKYHLLLCGENYGSVSYTHLAVYKRQQVMIRAVIFDMEGVLVDSEMLYLNLRYQFAKGKNPEVTLEELYPTVGRSSEGSWGIVAKAVDNGMTWQELLAEYKEKVVVTCLLYTSRCG